MHRFFVKSLAGCFVCFTMIAFAEEPPEETASTTCPYGEQHYRVSLRHIESGGIGYDQGYTTLEGFFAPDPQQLVVMPFLDLRGHVFNNGKMAANAGVGFRGIAGCRTYGLNAYYDYRNTKKLHYNQVGLGFETLGRLLDFRINGYLPVGKKITAPYDSEFGEFSDHYLYVSQKHQFAMKGADAEFGFHFGKTLSFDFYGAAGPYYFVGEIGPNTWGGKGRLAGRYKEYITLEVSDSYDNMFHNHFQGQITFSFPFGGKSRVKTTKGSCNSCGAAQTIVSRMIQPVAREEIVVVGKERRNEVAIDPTTGEPYFFVFVNNLSHSSGTYESPYPTLALAQANSGPGDVIYVYAGDGTTAGMDEGITLQANQFFLGAGVAQPIQIPQGTITIPAQSGSLPLITNGAGSGIVLASGNQVSGIAITGTFENGIFGVDPGNVSISSTTITSSQLDQIHLDYTTSSGSIALNNLTLADGLQSGVSITSASSPSLSCTISNCNLQNHPVFSIDSSIPNQSTFSLTNNVVQNGGPTSLSFGGNATLFASGNTYTGNTTVSSPPLLVTAATSPISATIENNNISGNVCGGISFALSDTSLAQLAVTNNTISNNGSGTLGPNGAAIFVNANSTTTGNCNLVLTNNTISGNDKSAVYCTNGSFDTYQVTATGNQITGNQGAGFVFDNPCTTLTMIAASNTISNGTDQGIATAGNRIMTTVNMTLTDNQINDNTNSANGVSFSHTGTDLNLIVLNNEINGNDTSAIIVYSNVLIDNINARIEGNTMNNNQNVGFNAAGGIDIEQFTNLSIKLLNNTLLGNTGVGVAINSTLGTPAVCLNMTGNNTDSDYVLTNTSGSFNLTPCDVSTINTGMIIETGVTHIQSCPGGALCPP